MENKSKRILMTVLGVLLVGISIGFFKLANWGTDPFTVFCNGLANIFHTTYGNIFLGVSVILFITIWIINKHLFGLATIFTMFGIGFIVDFTSHILNARFVNPGIPARTFFLALAIIVMCFASSLYFTANLGVSTYDSIALTVTEKMHVPFRICRIVSDFICVIIGFSFGSTIGIGTLITALFMGPLIQYFNKKFSEPYLSGTLTKGKKESAFVPNWY